MKFVFSLIAAVTYLATLVTGQSSPSFPSCAANCVANTCGDNTVPNLLCLCDENQAFDFEGCWSTNCSSSDIGEAYTALNSLCGIYILIDGTNAIGPLISSAVPSKTKLNAVPTLLGDGTVVSMNPSAVGTGNVSPTGATSTLTFGDNASASPTRSSTAGVKSAGEKVSNGRMTGLLVVLLTLALAGGIVA
jgi:CFEM domain